MSEVMQHKNDTGFAITFSDAAVCHVVSSLNKNKANKGLRLSVKKTGCSGWSYAIEVVVSPQANDIVQTLTNDYKLYIDKASFPYLKGMKIDYVKQGLNYKFIFDNPNQSGQCGCGESFTVD